jgi:hypothetical protein
LQTTRIVTNHSVVVTLPNLELTIVKDKDQLTEVFDVALNITSLEATWDGLIQVVNWDHITLIQVIRAFEEYSNTHDLSSLSCILASIDSVELSDWVTKMVFKSLTVTPAKAGNDDTNALEQDLDHVITQVFQLVLDEYSQLWTLLSQGLIQGPARRFLNQWVKQWLEQHSSSTEKCPPSFPDKLLSMDRTATTTDKPWWIDFTKWKFLSIQ